MNVTEARKVIRDDSESFTNWTMAAAVLASAKESSLDDLVACLKRKGLPAEIAATALYVRTKRPRANESIDSIVLDPADWADYVSKLPRV